MVYAFIFLVPLCVPAICCHCCALCVVLVLCCVRDYVVPSKNSAPSPAILLWIPFHHKVKDQWSLYSGGIAVICNTWTWECDAGRLMGQGQGVVLHHSQRSQEDLG